MFYEVYVGSLFLFILFLYNINKQSTIMNVFIFSDNFKLLSKNPFHKSVDVSGDFLEKYYCLFN